MNKAMSVRLSLMMFLNFFVWGAWYPTIAVFMTENGMGTVTHWPYTGNAVAAMVSPFFLGLIADRYFATQKVLGTLHLLGGVFILLAPQFAASPILFISLVFLHNLCYMPTIGLANSLAFHHIEDQEKQFPLIRVFGTFGWIVVGLFISFVLGRFMAGQLRPEQTALPLYTTGAAALLMGLYSFTLPHTPPPAAGKVVTARSILGVDAFRQLASPSFYIFLISSMLICIPLTAYYNFLQGYLSSAGFKYISATQTLGQASEVIFMVLMPVFFARLGVKWMLVLGMGAWVVRYALFALGAPDAITWMILGGIVLHGICYDFFFVTGQIYMDKKAGPDIRGQAQGLIVFATYGVGMFIGAQVAGNLYNAFLGTAQELTPAQYQTFWMIPAALAFVIMIFFGVFFRDKVDTEAAVTKS